jgi:hypothetical protein
MAGATYFKRRQSSFTLLHGPQRRLISFSLSIPKAPRQAPPTSSRVQVNIDSPVAVTDGFRSTELEARLHLALPTLPGPRGH